jgi:hypothetical protein
MTELAAPSARRSRAITVACASAASILLGSLLAGCTDPQQGTVESPSETETNQTPTEASNFVMEFAPDSCASSEEIPDAYALPTAIGYTEEFSTPDFHESLWCTYRSGSPMESLNGIETLALASGTLQFTITDGESSLTPGFTGSAVDPENDPNATSFLEWSDVSQKIAADYSVTVQGGIGATFDLFARQDNLYLAVSMTFIVPDEVALEAGTQVPEAEIAAAAYEILDVLMPSVVDGLERE